MKSYKLFIMPTSCRNVYGTLCWPRMKLTSFPVTNPHPDTRPPTGQRSNQGDLQSARASINVHTHTYTQPWNDNIFQWLLPLFFRNCRPNPELTITSPFVHSRVESNTSTLGNPMPESTLSPSQGLCLDYASGNRANFQIYILSSQDPRHRRVN
jgi:hypothetical protein